MRERLTIRCDELFVRVVRQPCLIVRKQAILRRRATPALQGTDINIFYCVR